MVYYVSMKDDDMQKKKSSIKVYMCIYIIVRDSNFLRTWRQRQQFHYEKEHLKELRDYKKEKVKMSILLFLSLLS